MTRTHALPRRTRPGRLALACLAALGLLAPGAGAAPASNILVTLPTVIASPGSTVDIPIEASPAPAGLGIYSIDFRLTLNSAVVQSSAVLADGFLQSWGPPFVNATGSFIAVAAAGSTALTSSSTHLGTVRLVIQPTAVPGTDVPLTFQHIWFNDGSPGTVIAEGLLRIRAPGVGVEDGALAAFALDPAAPSPARRATQLSFTLPTGGTRARLAIYAVDGRLVRTLEHGALGAGRHASAWDLRDAAGSPVAAGLYFARLEAGSRRAERRIVVVR